MSQNDCCPNPFISAITHTKWACINCEQEYRETLNGDMVRMSTSEERVKAVEHALQENASDIRQWFEYGRSKGLKNVAVAAMAAADATRPVTDEMQVIQERDEYEEFISDIAFDLGCREEWSNLHDHRVCIKDELAALEVMES